VNSCMEGWAHRFQVAIVKLLDDQCAGHRRFPAAQQLSDEENEDPSPSPAGSAAEAAQLETDAVKTTPQPAEGLVNCMVVWRYESCAVDPFGEDMAAEPAVVDESTAEVPTAADEQRT